MGPEAPYSFTIKEDIMYLRGILPELEYTFTESQIRGTIASIINAHKELEIEEDDFEFLEANGKHLCVPAQTPEFKWTGRALKELAGTGCIYVRLTCDDLNESENPESPDLKIVKVETAGN